jgi:hypothetical protein
MLIEDGKFRLFYHYGEENFTRCTLDFYKAMKGFKKDAIDFKPEDSIEFRVKTFNSLLSATFECGTSSDGFFQFQVDPFCPPLTNHKKFQILKQLQIDQARACDLARKAEDEVRMKYI